MAKTKLEKVIDMTKPQPLSDPLVRDLVASTIIKRLPKNKYFISSALNNIKLDKKTVLSELEVLSKWREAKASITQAALYKNRLNINIEFKSDEITMSDIKLGDFNVKMTSTIGNGNVSPHISATALKPNLSKTTNIPHPNVNYNGGVCLGEGANSYNRAIKQGRFIDAAEIVNNMLQTYSSSPFGRIEDWLGYKCANCESIVSSALNSCRTCDGDICNKCDRKNCDFCKSYAIHSGCAKGQECDKCKKYSCWYCKIVPNNKSEYNDSNFTCRCDYKQCVNCYHWLDKDAVDKNNRCSKCKLENCEGCDTPTLASNLKHHLCYYCRLDKCVDCTLLFEPHLLVNHKCKSCNKKKKKVINGPKL